MVQSHYFLGINVVLEQNVVSREEARRNDEKRDRGDPSPSVLRGFQACTLVCLKTAEGVCSIQ